MTLRVALYARVSTADQDHTMQLREMREYCAQKRWEVIHEYVDHGWSGAKERRPGLDRLMDDAYAKKFDVVLVWKFDRFARSVSHLLRALEEFNHLKVAFVSVKDQVDTTTPVGKMIFTVMGAMSELERSLIIERVRAGLRNAQLNGKKLGRPKCKVTREQVTHAVRQHGSLRKAAEALGISYGRAHYSYRGLYQ